MVYSSSAEVSSPTFMIVPRSFFTAVVITITLVGGIFLILEYKNAPTEYRTGAFGRSGSAVALDADTDGDGLKDWEESLWQTNPREADTDADGTADGEEVRTGRNPARRGPDDAFTEKAAAQGQSGETEELSTTERVSREFFARYLSLKEAGVSLSAEESGGIIKDAIQSAGKTSFGRV
ncbi:MAG: hypothetical protein G01um101472_10 [Parcubacteria group bacterium Gr01-1014_72]|nr:MAG: hypothetical protein G01um101472_10 [Parcubacteria group bacterium Gr01-1014_72]